MKSKITLIFFLLFILSCEELVETDFPNNQISSTQIFEEIHTADAAINSLYSSLRDQSVLSGGSDGTGVLLSIYTDDLDCYYEDNNSFKDIYLNQQQASNLIIENVWNRCYQQIYMANSIISGVNSSISLPEANKKYLKGEALFIRSLLYFYLQQLIGEIPYTTSIDYQYNSTLGKMPESELLYQLIDDLLQSIALLTDNYRDTLRIFPNQKAAQLLLSRLYLTIGDYQKAEITASEIIQSSLYNFEPDVLNVFHNSGSHIIWQLQTDTPGFPTWEAITYNFSDSPPYSFALSTYLIDSFSDQDLRKQNWIEPVTYEGQTWYKSSKYKNVDYNDNEYSIIFRLAEVYLIYAEALVKQNKINQAIPYLNAIRLRAGLDPVNPLSQEDAMTEILLEKRKEFFTESGHRFLDLKRMDLLDYLSSVKPSWAHFKRVWPLPQKELLLNPHLNPQNEGY